MEYMPTQFYFFLNVSSAPKMYNLTPVCPIYHGHFCYEYKAIKT